jgi:hypothetical protein
MTDRVVDEHGRLTAETKAELSRIFGERPDLLEVYVDGLSTIFRDAARRPATPARTHRGGIAFHNGPSDADPQTDENLPEEVPALIRPGERTR